MDLFGQLLTGRNASLTAAIFVILTLMKPGLANFFRTPWGKRLLPVLPVALGVALAFAGLSDATTKQDKFLIGVIAGFVAGHTFKIGRTSLLGIGIEDDDSAPAPVVAPVIVPVITAPAAVAAPVTPEVPTNVVASAPAVEAVPAPVPAGTPEAPSSPVTDEKKG